MKILKEEYKDEELALGFFDTYFKGMKYAIFDIETTGLSPKNCQVILSGFVIPTGNGNFQMIQYFAETLSDEAEVLIATMKILENVDFIITFNGQSFDIPFVEKRVNALNINSFKKPSQVYNLDIYRLVRKFSDVKKFVPNLKQKTLENFLGLYTTRDDQIDGGKSVDQYFEYLATKDPELERTILLHNSDDVKQLYRLCNILKKVDFHQAMANVGFPCNATTIENISLIRGMFRLTGRTLLADYTIYDDNTNLKLTIVHGILILNLQLNEKDGLTFLDLQGLFQACLDNGFAVHEDFQGTLDYFKNCNGLYLDRFLMLVVDGETNYKAANLLGKYLIERIELNDN